MPGRKPRRPLPGDPSGRKLVERALRVDHAGEYGAKRIYAGQLAILGDTETGAVIREMAATEDAHLDWFGQAIVERGVRPTALHPVWHVAGYALGAATAMLGPRAAMACTVAVEEVIDEHYGRQVEALGGPQASDNRRLKAKIEKFRAEEVGHRDTALAHDAEKAPLYRAMSLAIKTGCRAAIWLSERV